MTQRVLFISLSCVGDAVMTTPVLEALHQHYPEAKVDIVADRRSSILFSRCPYRGDIIHKNKQALLRGALELLSRLRNRRYDVIVDLRTDGLAYLFKGKKRFTKWGAKSYGPHSVQTLMGVIKRLHGDRPVPDTRVWIDRDDEHYAKERLSVLPEGKILALGPACGGTEPQKVWPAENYAQLANRLRDIFSSVVLLGRRQDLAMTGAIGNALTLPFIDTAGQTTLLEVAALQKAVQFYVGSDSGLGHIAAAMSTPTLSFFSVADPERCLPWGDGAHWIMGPDRDARKISVDVAENKIRNVLI